MKIGINSTCKFSHLTEIYTKYFMCRVAFHMHQKNLRYCIYVWLVEILIINLSILPISNIVNVYIMKLFRKGIIIYIYKTNINIH